MQAVRRLLEDLRFDVFLDQGAAWHASDHRTVSFSVSVHKGRARELRQLPMLQTLDGVQVRGYPNKLIVWYTGGYTWWLHPQGAPPEDERPNVWHLRLPKDDTLARLVRKSVSVDIAKPS